MPSELKCCLLITEAIAKAGQAALGGGPSNTIHRQLDLADRWMKEGAELLAFQFGLDSNLFDMLRRACTDTLPSLIAEARVALPAPGDGDSNRRDNEIFEEARTQGWYLEDRLGRALKLNHAFVALTSSSQKWAILGFRDEAEYSDFLYPSVQTLARNPDPMQHDLFVRLLAQAEFSPHQLRVEGYRQSLVMDTVNALVKAEWAEWTDLSELGSKAKGKMTPVGQRLLRQLIANPDSELYCSSARTRIPGSLRRTT